MQTLIIAQKLKGAMFWALPLDDFTGNFCGAGRFPLMNAVKQELLNQEPLVPTTKSLTATKPKSTKVTATKGATVKTTKATTKKATAKPIKTVQPGNNECFAIHAWYKISTMDHWCVVNCARGYCPKSHCSCDPNWKQSHKCKAIGLWKGQRGMDRWCNDNCPINNCSKMHCVCDL